jgi:hypothetical protein
VPPQKVSSFADDLAKVREANSFADDLERMRREAASKKAEPSALSRFGTGLYETGIVPLIGAAKTATRMLYEPQAVMAEAAQAGGDEGGRLYNLATKGNTGKSALNWLPVVGPGLARTADKIRTGNYAGAAGDMTGLALPEMATATAGTVGRMGERAAVNWEGRLLKPKEKTIQSTIEYKATGSKPAGLEAVARTNLERGTGTIRSGNVARGQAGLDALDDQLNQAISTSTATIPRAALEQALRDEWLRVGTGSTAQAGLRGGLTRAWEELQRFGNDIPVQTAQRAKQAIYQARNYASTAADAASANADKTLGRAYRAEIANAVPAVEPINAEFSRHIPAQAALEDASFRVSKRDPIGFSQLIAGASGKPLPIIGAVVNHPTVGSFGAQRMFDASRMMSRGGMSADAIRAAILALLTQQQEQ